MTAYQVQLLFMDVSGLSMNVFEDACLLFCFVFWQGYMFIIPLKAAWSFLAVKSVKKEGKWAKDTKRYFSESR